MFAALFKRGEREKTLSERRSIEPSVVYSCCFQGYSLDGLNVIFQSLLQHEAIFKAHGSWILWFSTICFRLMWNLVVFIHVALSSSC